MPILIDIRKLTIIGKLIQRGAKKEENREFQLRIFLVPDPGAFVNPIDKLDIEEIREIDDLTARQGDNRAF